MASRQPTYARYLNENSIAMLLKQILEICMIDSLINSDNSILRS